MDPERSKMQLDQPPSSGLAEGPNSLLTLSPVIEIQEEDSSLEEERFADALEETTIGEEKDEIQERSKRDSKFEDDFEASQLAKIKEQAVMQDEPVNIDHSQSTDPATCENENNETIQTQSPPQIQPHPQQEDHTGETKHVYPSQPVLILLITGLCLSVLLVSLDRTIITTVCLPLIESQF